MEKNKHIKHNNNKDKINLKQQTQITPIKQNYKM